MCGIFNAHTQTTTKYLNAACMTLPVRPKGTESAWSKFSFSILILNLYSCYHKKQEYICFLMNGINKFLFRTDLQKLKLRKSKHKMNSLMNNEQNDKLNYYNWIFRENIKF